MSIFLIFCGWQRGRLVRVLDFETVDPGFESHSELFMDLFHGSLNHVTMFHLQYFFQLFEWQYPGELSVLITIIIINLHFTFTFFPGHTMGCHKFSP